MRKKVFVALIASIGMCVGLVSGAGAVINDKIDQPNNLAGLALSPMTSGKLNMEPGESYDGRFRVRMTGHETQNVVASVAPYSAGSPDNYSNSDFSSETRYNKIIDWAKVTLEEDETCEVDRYDKGKVYFQLDPQEECYLNYQIKVPSDAFGGAQRMAIFVRTINETASEDGGTGINSQYQIGYTVTSSVDGPDAKAKGHVVETKIPQLLFVPPVTSSVKVENTGNLDFEAEYKMTVKTFFRKKEVYVNESNATVMAETSRVVSTNWNETPSLGLFRVTQETTVLGETSTLTKTVLVIPIALIVAIIVAILLLILWIYVKVRKNRKGSKSRK